MPFHSGPLPAHSIPSAMMMMMMTVSDTWIISDSFRNFEIKFPTPPVSIGKENKSSVTLIPSGIARALPRSTFLISPSCLVMLTLAQVLRCRSVRVALNRPQCIPRSRTETVHWLCNYNKYSNWWSWFMRFQTQHFGWPSVDGWMDGLRCTNSDTQFVFIKTCCYSSPASLWTFHCQWWTYKFVC